MRAVTATLLVLVAVYHVFDAIQAVTVSALRGYKRAVVPMVDQRRELVGRGSRGRLRASAFPTCWTCEPSACARLSAPPGFWAAAIAGLAVAFAATVAYYLVVSAPAPCLARNLRRTGIRKPSQTRR